MERYHIVKDGKIIGSTATEEQAIIMIRLYQEQETHYMLRAEFSYIKGAETFVPYEKKGGRKNGKSVKIEKL